MDLLLFYLISIKDEVSQVFDFFDDDNNEEITQEEISSVMSILNHKNTDKMMDKLDSNRDGTITIDEMKNSNAKAKPKSTGFKIGITILIFVIMFAFVYAYLSKYRNQNCLHKRLVSFLSHRRKPLELS